MKTLITSCSAATVFAVLCVPAPAQVNPAQGMCDAARQIGSESGIRRWCNPPSAPAEVAPQNPTPTYEESPSSSYEEFNSEDVDEPVEGTTYDEELEEPLDSQSPYADEPSDTADQSDTSSSTQQSKSEASDNDISLADQADAEREPIWKRLAKCIYPYAGMCVLDELNRKADILIDDIEKAEKENSF